MLDAANLADAVVAGMSRPTEDERKAQVMVVMVIVTIIDIDIENTPLYG